jgi:hypothetical protein
MKRQEVGSSKEGREVASARESAVAFLRRMRNASPADDEAIAEVEAAVDENRRRWRSTTVS